MGHYFGTDGFRGEANVRVTAGQAFEIGRFLGWYYTERRRTLGSGGKARAVIGKDTRHSGYMYEYALAAGLNASGADAHLMHVTTTPSVAYACRVGDFDCGLMVSASHNPFDDNGIKLFDRGGGKMPEAVLDAAERYLDGMPPAGCRSGGIPYATRRGIGRTADAAILRSRYIAYLTGLVPFSLRGVRVGLDCANGSAWSIAPAIFEALGATVTALSARPNGVNINRACGSTHPERLQEAVRAGGLDVGFAFDGDADRCIAVDENGRVVDGDGILAVCAPYCRSRGELPGNTVVTTVMSNGGLFRLLADEGIAVRVTPVGDKYVRAAMEREGFGLGGEQSGHVIFGKYAVWGDGILTALKLMEVMRECGEPLSRLSAGLIPLPQLTRSLPAGDPAGTVESDAVQEAIRTAEGIVGAGGRVLVRASGTEPVVRVMTEASDPDRCRAALDTVAQAVYRQTQGTR